MRRWFRRKEHPLVVERPMVGNEIVICTPSGDRVHLMLEDAEFGEWRVTRSFGDTEVRFRLKWQEKAA